MARSRAILVDIDNTLSMRGERGPFDFDRCDELDTPNEGVVACVTAMALNGFDVVFSSGREEKYRPQTERFIKRCLPWLSYELFMRPTKDRRQDSVVKREIYENKIVDRYEIIFALDDRDQVVSMYRDELGLRVFQVNYGNF